MTDERLTKSENQVVLDDCRSYLENKGTTENDTERLCGVLDEALQDGVVEQLRERFHEQVSRYGDHPNERSIRSIVRGQLFETVALRSIPEMKPRERDLGWYILRGIKQDKYAVLNDVVFVDYTTDQETNQIVAKIRGVGEAKDHLPSLNKLDGRQVEEAPYELRKFIYLHGKELLQQMRESGAAEGPVPDRIEVVDPKDFIYTFILPKNFTDPSTRTGMPAIFRDCKYAFGQITQNELFLISAVLEDRMVEELKVRNELVETIAV